MRKIMLKTIMVVSLFPIFFMIFGCSGVRPAFDRELREMVKRQGSVQKEPVTQSELDAMPEPIRRYLVQSGFASRDKVKWIHMRYKGFIRTQTNMQYMPIECEQYDSADLGTRLWYAKEMVLPFIYLEARHIYKGGYASMLIKLGPVTIADVKGAEANQSDMITYFNDIFLSMPSAVINSDIAFETTGSNTVKAFFSDGGLKASAVLYFNSSGELTNFITEDRYAITGTNIKRYPWMTPVYQYRERNGLKEAVAANAVWKTPWGDDVYFKINDPAMLIEYNELPRMK